MNLNDWAVKHHIPYTALEDLKRLFRTIPTDTGAGPGKSEAAVQNEIRLEASRKGCRLMRNNVGATYTDDGSFIRYGLANDSKQMNDKIKSSDLIGVRPVKITPLHVGGVLGVFLAREVKPEGWIYSGSKREEAQLNFLKLIASLGGDACFANCAGTI